MTDFGSLDTGTDSRYDVSSSWQPRVFGLTEARTPSKLNEIRLVPKRKYRRKDAVSASAMPGQAITIEVVEKQERSRVLLNVIARFASEGEISKATLESAVAFLNDLPEAAGLPKLASDAEGGLLMAWSVQGQGRTLVTVIDGVVHAVSRAGTADAAYFADLPFDGTVPAEVLEIIPA